MRVRVLPGQREPALPASALRHPSQHRAAPCTRLASDSPGSSVAAPHCSAVATARCPPSRSGAHRMGELGLDRLTRRIRLLCRPVPEARPEPMRHGGDAEFLDQFRQRHVGERLPAGPAEHQAGAVTASPCVVQDRERQPGRPIPAILIDPLLPITQRLSISG